MAWLRKRIEARFDPDRPHEVNGEDRQVFLVLATSLLGRDATEGSSFDDEVRAAVSTASRGEEGTAFTALARSVRDHDVAITLDELGSFGRCARLFNVTEDGWTFLGASVPR